jgi:hypothetical protein
MQKDVDVEEESQRQYAQQMMYEHYYHKVRTSWGAFVCSTDGPQMQGEYARSYAYLTTVLFNVNLG